MMLKYKGMTLLSVLGKLSTKIYNHRLSNWVEIIILLLKHKPIFHQTWTLLTIYLSYMSGTHTFLTRGTKRIVYSLTLLKLLII